MIVIIIICWNAEKMKGLRVIMFSSFHVTIQTGCPPTAKGPFCIVHVLLCTLGLPGTTHMRSECIDNDSLFRRLFSGITVRVTISTVHLSIFCALDVELDVPSATALHPHLIITKFSE